MEESVAEEEDEGVLSDEVEPSESTEFLTTLVDGLRERSVTVGKIDEEISVKEYVETSFVQDTEARDIDGDRRSGGET